MGNLDKVHELPEYEQSIMKNRNHISPSVFFLSLLLIFAASVLQAQQIITAPNFFSRVGDRYEEIEDYTADISMRKGDTRMSGELFHRYPNLLRINFTNPQEQVLVTDGSTLTLYVPALDVTMQQSLGARQQDEEITALATREGLGLLRRLYNVSYLTDPTPVPLREGSEVMVVNLRLTWRNPSEGFREIVIAVDDDMLIRRMIGTTVNYEEVVLEFNNIELNQNLTMSQFEYRSPPSANRFNNFLFGAQN
ncbi:hypothetical protein JCM12856_17680 [Spirochaeta dissipatitropha]